MHCDVLGMRNNLHAWAEHYPITLSNHTNSLLHCDERIKLFSHTCQPRESSLAPQWDLEFHPTVITPWVPITHFFKLQKIIRNFTKVLLAYHREVLCFLCPNFTGSITDKELTRQSGLLDLLQRDDSGLMAYKGFDILEDFAPCGVGLLTFLFSSWQDSAWKGCTVHG